MSNFNSPVGLGLARALMGGALAAGGLSSDDASLIIDPGSDPPSGGPNPSTNQVFAGLFWASRVLSVSQMRTMFSAPITMALGTPNSTLVPLMLIGRMVNPGAVAFSATRDIIVRWTGGPIVAPMGAGLQAFFSASGAGVRFGAAPLTNIMIFSGSTEVRGLDLNIQYGGSDITGGAASAFAQFSLLYSRILSTQ